MGILKRNIIKNGVSSSLATAVRACEQLVLIPFYISAWGATEYGEWLTITAIPTMLAFADFGFGTAISNSFVLSYVSNDKDKAASIAKTGFLIMGAVIFTCILLSLLIIVSLQNIGVFNQLIFKEQDTILSLSCLLGARIIGFIGTYSQGYYRALRLAALGINIKTGYNIFNVILILFILYIKGDIVLLAFSQLLSSLIYNIGNTVYSFHRIKLDNWRESPLLSKSEIISITQKGISYLAAPISQSLYNQGITLLIRISIGAYAVTVFNTLKTLSRSINQVISIIKNSIFPELQYEIGKGNYKSVQKVYCLAQYGSVSIAIFSSVLLLLFGNKIYNWWINENINIESHLWYIFILIIITNSIWWTSSAVFAASNKPQKLAIGDIVSSFISVLTSYILGLKYEITGFAIGLLIYEIMMTIWVLPNSRNLIYHNTNKSD
ncbi:MAG: lipopolysaccharide biosynthesis protein [Bacteroidaceae bacterium]|nr:lipopolysaccharide biosynthesis protein [Bacteroidaceae bacterium]